jgi:serine protease Do
VMREGASQRLTLKLAPGWRQAGDLSWRASSWGYRRMTTGGASLESLTDSDRKQLGLEKAAMALRVKHVGQYGPHAAAKNAGVKAGDILVKFGDRDDLKSETELLAYGLKTFKTGDAIAMVVNRSGKEMRFEIKSQP